MAHTQTQFQTQGCQSLFVSLNATSSLKNTVCILLLCVDFGTILDSLSSHEIYFDINKKSYYSVDCNTNSKASFIHCNLKIKNLIVKYNSNNNDNTII